MTILLLQLPTPPPISVPAKTLPKSRANLGGHFFQQDHLPILLLKVFYIQTRIKMKAIDFRNFINPELPNTMYTTNILVRSIPRRIPTTGRERLIRTQLIRSST